MLVFICGEFRKNLATLSRLFAASADSRFEFHKRRQLFIRAHNETLSVAVRVHDPDCSPFGIPSWDPVQTPTGLLEVVGDSLVTVPLDFAHFLACD